MHALPAHEIPNEVCPKHGKLRKTEYPWIHYTSHRAPGLQGHSHASATELKYQAYFLPDERSLSLSLCTELSPPLSEDPQHILPQCTGRAGMNGVICPALRHKSVRHSNIGTTQQLALLSASVSPGTVVTAPGHICGGPYSRTGPMRKGRKERKQEMNSK